LGGKLKGERRKEKGETRRKKREGRREKGETRRKKREGRREKGETRRKKREGRRKTEEKRREKEDGRISPSNFEGVSRKARRGSLYKYHFPNLPTINPSKSNNTLPIKNRTLSSATL